MKEVDREEKMQVLKMIEEGKVSPEEALELLTALEKKQDGAAGGFPRWLRVRVKEKGDKTRVKVNLPISLVQIGLKLGRSFVPELRNAGLEKEDIENIMRAIKDGAEGKIVEVEDEDNDTTVEVFVE